MKMEIEETHLEGCYVIEPKVFKDERGYFFESFNLEAFEKTIGRRIYFVQDNQSFSKKGVLRGLHFQKGKYAQAKLVRVLSGRVLDVVVDLRRESETFGEHFAIELSGANKKQLFIPRGFAHGFIVLSTKALFSYKCDNYYHPKSEGGIIFNDSELNINWRLLDEEIIVSEKDRSLERFNRIRLNKAEF